MGKKYICEVKKVNDGNDHQLKLIDAKDYDYASKTESGSITFSGKNQLNSYLNTNCVSVDKLQQIQNSTNNLFTFLFFLLLFLFIVTIVCQMMGKSKKAAVTSFGRFSF